MQLLKCPQACLKQPFSTPFSFVAGARGLFPPGFHLGWLHIPEGSFHVASVAQHFDKN